MSEPINTEAQPTENNVAKPISAAERIDVIDILRGLAILGILLVNMNFFSHPVYAAFAGGIKALTIEDKFAEYFVRFFAEGKFYTLFSFLFGLGMAVIMSRLQARGKKFAPVYARRILILLIIGLIHAFLIWSGDILVPYAIFGFILIAFEKCKAKTLLVWFVVLMMIPLILNGAVTGLMELSKASPEAAEKIEEARIQQETNSEKMLAESYKIYKTGTYAETTKMRAKDLSMMYTGLIFFGWTILAMFLLGSWAWQKGLFTHLDDHIPFFKKLMIAGFLIGVPLTYYFTIMKDQINPTWPSPTGFLVTAAQQFGSVGMCLFYISSIVLLTRIKQIKRFLSPISAIGRTALSNYILQSLVCTAIFYSHGLQMFGQTYQFYNLILAVIIYLIQIPISMLWLSKFRFGPLEWIWRSLTYGKKQPMKI